MSVSCCFPPFSFWDHLLIHQLSAALKYQSRQNTFPFCDEFEMQSGGCAPITVTCTCHKSLGAHSSRGVKGTLVHFSKTCVSAQEHKVQEHSDCFTAVSTPSIDPCFSNLWSDCSSSRLSRIFQSSLSPATLSSSSRVAPTAPFCQIRYNPSSEFRVFPMVPLQLAVLRNTPKGESQDTSHARTTLACSLSTQRSPILSSLWISESPSHRLKSAALQRKLTFNLYLLFHGHQPELMTSVGWKLPLTHIGPVQCPHHRLHFPVTSEQDTKILVLIGLRWQSPTQSGQSPILGERVVN